MLKRKISLFVAAAVTLGIMAGCSSNNSSSATTAAPTPTPAASATDNSAASTTAAATTNDFASTTDTYTIFVSGGTATQFNWSNPVAQAITAQTGVVLQPDVCLDSNPNDKLNLMLASGTYDDLILGIQTSDMPSWLAAKALVPLDDLISQYGPNLQQHYGTMIDRLKFSTQYPNIYGFGTGSSTTASYEPGNYWQICFMVQEGALKAQGYPTIKTPTDFENVLKTDLANNPTTPDGLKKVGLDLVTSDGWRYGMSLVQPAFDTAGLPGGSIGRIYLDPTTNQLVFGTIQPVFQTYMQWLNKLYNEGLIDPQSFTQTYDDYIAEMSSGQCVGCIDGYWEMYQADVALKTGKYPSESYMEFPVLTDPSSMTWCEDQPGNPLGEGGISVSSSCKNPAKIVNFMDFMVSEPGQILRWWGVEGTDYTVDANNQRVQSTADATAYNSNMIGFEQTSGVQLYTNDGGEWLDNPYGWTTSNGQDLIVTSNLSSAYTQDDIDCMTAYGVKNYCEYFPDPSKQGNQPYGSISALPSGLTDDTKADNTNLGNDELQYYTNMITCTPDQFSTQWQAWVTQAQNDGCQALLDEANTALQDRIQLWGLTPQSN